MESVLMNQFWRRIWAFQQINSSQLQNLDSLHVPHAGAPALPAAGEKSSINLKSSHNFTRAVFEHSQVS